MAGNLISNRCDPMSKFLFTLFVCAQSILANDIEYNTSLLGFFLTSGPSIEFDYSDQRVFTTSSRNGIDCQYGEYDKLNISGMQTCACDHNKTSLPVDSIGNIYRIVCGRNESGGFNTAPGSVINGRICPSSTPVCIGLENIIGGHFGRCFHSENNMDISLKHIYIHGTKHVSDYIKTNPCDAQNTQMISSQYDGIDIERLSSKTAKTQAAKFLLDFVQNTQPVRESVCTASVHTWSFQGSNYDATLTLPEGENTSLPRVSVKGSENCGPPEAPTGFIGISEYCSVGIEDQFPLLRSSATEVLMALAVFVHVAPSNLTLFGEYPIGSGIDNWKTIRRKLVMPDTYSDGVADLIRAVFIILARIRGVYTTQPAWYMDPNRVIETGSTCSNRVGFDATVVIDTANIYICVDDILVTFGTTYSLSTGNSMTGFTFNAYSSVGNNTLCVHITTLGILASIVTKNKIFISPGENTNIVLYPVLGTGLFYNSHRIESDLFESVAYITNDLIYTTKSNPLENMELKWAATESVTHVSKLDNSIKVFKWEDGVNATSRILLWKLVYGDFIPPHVIVVFTDLSVTEVRLASVGSSINNSPQITWDGTIVTAGLSLYAIHIPVSYFRYNVSGCVISFNRNIILYPETMVSINTMWYSTQTALEYTDYTYVSPGSIYIDGICPETGGIITFSYYTVGDDKKDTPFSLFNHQEEIIPSGVRFSPQRTSLLVADVDEKIDQGDIPGLCNSGIVYNDTGTLYSPLCYPDYTVHTAYDITPRDAMCMWGMKNTYDETVSNCMDIAYIQMDYARSIHPFSPIYADIVDLERDIGICALPWYSNTVLQYQILEPFDTRLEGEPMVSMSNHGYSILSTSGEYAPSLNRKLFGTAVSGNRVWVPGGLTYRGCNAVNPSIGGSDLCMNTDLLGKYLGSISPSSITEYLTDGDWFSAQNRQSYAYERRAWGTTKNTSLSAFRYNVCMKPTEFKRASAYEILANSSYSVFNKQIYPNMTETIFLKTNPFINSQMPSSCIAYDTPMAGSKYMHIKELRLYNDKKITNNNCENRIFGPDPRKVANKYLVVSYIGPEWTIETKSQFTFNLPPGFSNCELSIVGQYNGLDDDYVAIDISKLGVYTINRYIVSQICDYNCTSDCIGDNRCKALNTLSLADYQRDPECSEYCRPHTFVQEYSQITTAAETACAIDAGTTIGQTVVSALCDWVSLPFRFANTDQFTSTNVSLFSDQPSYSTTRDSDNKRDNLRYNGLHYLHFNQRLLDLVNLYPTYLKALIDDTKTLGSVFSDLDEKFQKPSFFDDNFDVEGLVEAFYSPYTQVKNISVYLKNGAHFQEWNTFDAPSGQDELGAIITHTPSVSHKRLCTTIDVLAECGVYSSAGGFITNITIPYYTDSPTMFKIDDLASQFMYGPGHAGAINNGVTSAWCNIQCQEFIAFVIVPSCMCAKHVDLTNLDTYSVDDSDVTHIYDVVSITSPFWCYHGAHKASQYIQNPSIINGLRLETIPIEKPEYNMPYGRLNINGTLDYPADITRAGIGSWCGSVATSSLCSLGGRAQMCEWGKLSGTCTALLTPLCGKYTSEAECELGSSEFTMCVWTKRAVYSTDMGVYAGTMGGKYAYVLAVGENSGTYAYECSSITFKEVFNIDTATAVCKKGGVYPKNGNTCPSLELNSSLSSLYNLDLSTWSLFSQYSLYDNQAPLITSSVYHLSPTGPLYNDGTYNPLNMFSRTHMYVQSNQNTDTGFARWENMDSLLLPNSDSTSAGILVDEVAELKCKAVYDDYQWPGICLSDITQQITPSIWQDMLSSGVASVGINIFQDGGIGYQEKNCWWPKSLNLESDTALMTPVDQKKLPDSYASPFTGLPEQYYIQPGLLRRHICHTPYTKIDNLLISDQDRKVLCTQNGGGVVRAGYKPNSFNTGNLCSKSRQECILFPDSEYNTIQKFSDEIDLTGYTIYISPIAISFIQRIYMRAAYTDVTVTNAPNGIWISDRLTSTFGSTLYDDTDLMGRMFGVFCGEESLDVTILIPLLIEIYAHFKSGSKYRMVGPDYAYHDYSHSDVFSITFDEPVVHISWPGVTIKSAVESQPIMFGGIIPPLASDCYRIVILADLFRMDNAIINQTGCNVKTGYLRAPVLMTGMSAMDVTLSNIQVMDGDRLLLVTSNSTEASPVDNVNINGLHLSNNKVDQKGVPMYTFVNSVGIATILQCPIIGHEVGPDCVANTPDGKCNLYGNNWTTERPSDTNDTTLAFNKVSRIITINNNDLSVYLGESVEFISYYLIGQQSKRCVTISNNNILTLSDNPDSKTCTRFHLDQINYLVHAEGNPYFCFQAGNGSIYFVPCSGCNIGTGPSNRCNTTGLLVSRHNTTHCTDIDSNVVPCGYCGLIGSGCDLIRLPWTCLYITGSPVYSYDCDGKTGVLSVESAVWSLYNCTLDQVVVPGYNYMYDPIAYIQYMDGAQMRIIGQGIYVISYPYIATYSKIGKDLLDTDSPIAILIITIFVYTLLSLLIKYKPY